ncbi:GNAT family N-acetyltransferase [Nicoliella lavandulae]|uniref:GNAT family N-acetyltransferase n=1 Tax=Nicoliella lavandulae TaxID=3082954 RepID=A0ABU8SJ42_9LACO
MAEIYVRRGTASDLDSIMQIINEAKALLKADGSPQWQDGYPYVETLQADIDNHTNFVLIVDGKVAGTATLITTPEPNYATIDGSWKSDDQYATIHRIAISSHYRGQHLSSYFFSNLITITTLMGVHNVRFDTHPTNKRMQAIGKRFNFSYRGITQVDEPRDSNRYAYELNL